MVELDPRKNDNCTQALGLQPQCLHALISYVSLSIVTRHLPIQAYRKNHMDQSPKKGRYKRVTSIYEINRVMLKRLEQKHVNPDTMDACCSKRLGITVTHFFVQGMENNQHGCQTGCYFRGEVNQPNQVFETRPGTEQSGPADGAEPSRKRARRDDASAKFSRILQSGGDLRWDIAGFAGPHNELWSLNKATARAAPVALHTRHGQFRLKFERMCAINKATNIQHVTVSADAPRVIEPTEASRDRLCSDWTRFISLLTITAYHEELESMPPPDRALLWSAISETHLHRIRIVVDKPIQTDALVLSEMSEHLRRCRRPLDLVIRITDRNIGRSCRLPHGWVQSLPPKLRVLVTARAMRWHARRGWTCI